MRSILTMALGLSLGLVCSASDVFSAEVLAQCAALRQQASEALKVQAFEKASAILDERNALSGCEVALQDRIDQIYAHYKTAGYDGGAMGRAMDEGVRTGGEVFAVWAREQGKRAFSASEVKHIERAIELHEHLSSYYDKDAYYFRVMMLRLYRVFYLVAYAPDETASDINAALVYNDLVRAEKAFAQTTKYTPGILELIAAERKILDANASGQADRGELLSFMHRY